MTYQTITDANITSLDGVMIYIANNFPLFIPIFMVFLFLTVALGIYFGSKKFAGQADIFAAAAASGFLVSVIGTLMTLTFGIINEWILSCIIGLASLSVIMLLIKRNRD